MVKPSPGDINTELVVDRFTDIRGDPVWSGEESQQTRIKRRTRVFPCFAWTVHIEDEVHDDFASEDNHADRDDHRGQRFESHLPKREFHERCDCEQHADE